MSRLSIFLHFPQAEEKCDCISAMISRCGIQLPVVCKVTLYLHEFSVVIDLFNNVVTFRIADASINLPTFDMGHSGDIYFEFRTTIENAVIIHSKGPTDYIKISIIGKSKINNLLSMGSTYLYEQQHSVGKIICTGPVITWMWYWNGIWSCFCLVSSTQTSELGSC